MKKEDSEDILIAIFLFFVFISINILTNWWILAYNKPAYAFSLIENIMFIPITIMFYIFILFLIFLQIKLTRKRFVKKS